MKAIGRIALTLAIVGPTAVFALQQGTPRVFSMKNKPIPAFSMTDVAGKKITNKSLLGKVVLIDFWATWCGPCKKLSPIVDSLSKKYSKQGFVAIGASITDTKDKVIGYQKEHKYSYTFTVGNDALQDKWGFPGIPTMVLVDKKGVVREVKMGYSDSIAAELEKAIKAAL